MSRYLFADPLFFITNTFSKILSGYKHGVFYSEYTRIYYKVYLKL